MSRSHQETAPFVERLIFKNRIVVLLIFAIVTVLLGYQAAQVRPETSFEKMIPLTPLHRQYDRASERSGEPR